MKRNLFLSILLIAAVSVVAQQKAVYKAVKMNPQFKNFSLKKPIHPQKEYTSAVQMQPSVVKETTFEGIGSTVYDLQTNAATDHRMFYYPDATIGATFTFGMASTAYADRGTGYNYFDGNTWGAEPTARIETVRTGWPSYSSLGTNLEGEVVVAHNGTNLTMSRRTTKGTGSWTQTTIAGPAGASPTWPRVCTDGNNIHIIATESNSTPTSTGPGTAFNGQYSAPLYFRSTDGGQTFDINGVQIPQIDGTQYKEGFGGDGYAWAQPKNGTLAFLVGDSWQDLVLLKSIDNGSTWSKTIVFQHPYPNWTDSVLTPDTPYVCDGTFAVALDNSGKAHVVFGRYRVLNDSVGDNTTSWFPLTDGLIYWNEDMPTITETEMNSLDSLDAHGNLIAWCLDVDGSGTLFDNLTSTTEIASYYTGLTSMPQISIDDNNDIFVTYKMTMENMQTGSANQFCNHVWGRAYSQSEGQWAQFFNDITGSVDFEYAECVFPSMAKNTSSSQIFLWVQQDAEPGLSVRGDEDAAAVNYIQAFFVEKSDLLSVKPNPTATTLGESVNVYPNPASDFVNVSTSAVNGKIQSIRIVDMLGNEIRNLSVKSLLQENINISDLSGGIYNVIINTSKGTFTKKFIKE